MRRSMTPSAIQDPAEPTNPNRSRAGEIWCRFLAWSFIWLIVHTLTNEVLYKGWQLRKSKPHPRNANTSPPRDKGDRATPRRAHSEEETAHKSGSAIQRSRGRREKT